MNQTRTLQATLLGVDTTKTETYPVQTLNEFGFNSVDPIEPYPVEKINVGPCRLPSDLHACRIPLFSYLFMLDPNKTHKKYGWGVNI